MEYSHLLTLLTEDQRICIRKREKIGQKLNNAHTAVDFNKTCILNGLLPRYTYCRQANSRRTTVQERTAFLKEELLKKINEEDVGNCEQILIPLISY